MSNAILWQAHRLAPAGPAQRQCVAVRAETWFEAREKALAALLAEPYEVELQALDPIPFGSVARRAEKKERAHG